MSLRRYQGIGRLKDFRRAQLETCGLRHGVGPRAIGSKTKQFANTRHSIDTVDARRQVRQAKHLVGKATRLRVKRIARSAIADYQLGDDQ